MRRAIRRAIPYLLLGAAINVAVAWACALWSPVDAYPQYPGSWMGGHYVRGTLIGGNCDSDCPFPHPPAGEVYEVIHQATWARGLGIRLREFILTRHETDSIREALEPPVKVVIEWSAGWPCRSFGARLAIENPARQPVAGPVRPRTPTGAVAPPEWLRPAGAGAIGEKYVRAYSTTDRPLPLSPRVPGFLVNTALYAGAAHYLSLLTRRTRRTLRLRRGRCPRCAYPFGPGDLCPECGHSIASFKPRPPA